MSTKVFMITVLIVFLAIVMSSGCVNNPATPGVSLPTTPIPEAASLYTSGFNAYLKGDYLTALEFYNQSLVVDPKYTRAWIDKGDVLIKLNRTQEAIPAYDSALALENDLAIVWNSRGEALMAMGNYPAARESFDNALQIAPGYAAAKANRDLVQKKLP